MGLFGEKEIKNKISFNVVHVHILEETARGDLMKIGQLKRKLGKTMDDKEVYVSVFGEKLPIQPNELLPRADGSKDFFVLREGLGTFKALSLFHYSAEYFENNGDSDIHEHIKKMREKAIYLRSMNVNEKQVYKSTLKHIYSKGLGFWDKHGPALFMILILVLGLGDMIYMMGEVGDISRENSGAMIESARILADGFNQSVQEIRGFTGS
jgi:hypothetical protein